MSGLEANFQGLFFGGDEVKCPYCGLRFQTINQLKLHKQTYCATHEHYETVVEMFMKYANDLKLAGKFSGANEKSVIMLKGLYKLKAEFDLYQSYLDNPNIHILNSQKDKKFKEENTKKPNFTAMFSDFNPDAENMKEYPFLQSTLDQQFGEDLEAFMYRGEKTTPEDKKNVPSWFGNQAAKKQNEEKATQYLDDITKENIDKVVSKRIEGKDSLDLLQSDPEYIKIFTVLSKDLRGDKSVEEIAMFLKEPVSTWEDRYFNSDIKPNKRQVEAMMKEIEHPNERKSKYAHQIRDLMAIHDAMAGHILTGVDLEKRAELQKLIAEREFLFYRESLFLDDVATFKDMYFKRLDFVMYGLTPKPDLETAFKNLYLKLKYNQ